MHDRNQEQKLAKVLIFNWGLSRLAIGKSNRVRPTPQIHTQISINIPAPIIIMLMLHLCMKPTPGPLNLCTSNANSSVDTQRHTFVICQKTSVDTQCHTFVRYIVAYIYLPMLSVTHTYSHWVSRVATVQPGRLESVRRMQITNV